MYRSCADLFTHRSFLIHTIVASYKSAPISYSEIHTRVPPLTSAPAHANYGQPPGGLLVTAAGLGSPSAAPKKHSYLGPRKNKLFGNKTIEITRKGSREEMILGMRTQIPPTRPDGTQSVPPPPKLAGPQQDSNAFGRVQKLPTKWPVTILLIPWGIPVYPSFKNR